MTFISSLAAIGNWPILHPGKPLIPESPAQDSNVTMRMGYGESKNVAEQILTHANKICGIPVSIIRAGQIGGALKIALESWPSQG